MLLKLHTLANKKKSTELNTQIFSDSFVQNHKFKLFLHNINLAVDKNLSDGSEKNCFTNYVQNCTKVFLSDANMETFILAIMVHYLYYLFCNAVLTIGKLRGIDNKTIRR